MKLLSTLVFVSLFVVFMQACSANGEEAEFDVPDTPNKGTSEKAHSSSSAVSGSSTDDAGDSSLVFDSLYAFLRWVNIPSVEFTKGGNDYAIDAFSISATEVTQGAYAAVMDDMPAQPKDGDDYPVVNVSWYQAVLFCNAVSKYMGVDTVYSYTSVGDENYLEELHINYSASGYRLPTEMEWDVAARGGTTTAYYWGTEKASLYANYGQEKGPAEVAQLRANAYGLYDVAGNAAEWVNDWYDRYSTSDAENPTGPEKGSLRCVRGGSWADVLKDKDGNYPLQHATREKKDPLYSNMTIGFRLVRSNGF